MITSGVVACEHLGFFGGRHHGQWRHRRCRGHVERRQDRRGAVVGCRRHGGAGLQRLGHRRRHSADVLVQQRILAVAIDVRTGPVMMLDAKQVTSMSC